MKKALYLILLIAQAVFAQDKQLSPDQFIEDLNQFKRELPEKHKNLFAKISQADFNRKVLAIELKAPTLTNESFEIELYKLIKEIGDEHTRIEPVYKKVLPLKVDFFKEGIYVTHTSAAYSYLLSKKLDGINDSSISAVIKQFEEIIKTDNFSYFDVYFQQLVNKPAVLKGLNVMKEDASATFILDGKPQIISTLKKEDFHADATVQTLKNSKTDNYWYQPTDDFLYFNYQSCFEQTDKPFEAFNEDLWQFLEKNKPKKIVIDLRNNSGGNSAILNPFLDKLKSSYLNEKGRLFVLIGKSTFSSALMNAVNLKRNFNAILLGQPTSGNVNHYGETRGFQLLNTRLIVGYSTRYWEIWKGYEGALKPDVKIEYSIYNFNKGIDEALEYIKN